MEARQHPDLPPRLQDVAQAFAAPPLHPIIGLQHGHPRVRQQLRFPFRIEVLLAH